MICQGLNAIFNYMKKIFLIISAAFILFSFCSCESLDDMMNKEVATLPNLDVTLPNPDDSDKNDSGRFDYNKENLSDYVNVSAYKGLEIDIDYVTVSDETLEEEIKKLMKNNDIESIGDHEAEMLSNGKCKTADEFYEYYREILREEALSVQIPNEILNYIVDNSEFKKLPMSEIEFYRTDTILYYRSFAQISGIEYDSTEELLAKFDTSYEEISENSKLNVKRDLVYYTIIRREKLMFSDEDYDEVLTESAEYNLKNSPGILIAAGYKEETLENMKDYIDKNFSKDIIDKCFEKEMIKYLTSNNTVNEIRK